MNTFEAYAILQFAIIVIAILIGWWRGLLELMGLAEPGPELGNQSSFIRWTERGTRVVEGIHRAGSAATARTQRARENYRGYLERRRKRSTERAKARTARYERSIERSRQRIATYEKEPRTRRLRR